jgi:hypothetical protein
MASVKEIKTALAAQIQAQTGLTTLSRMPDQINPPVAAILPGLPYVKYGITMGESTIGLPAPVPVPAEINLVVCIFTSRAPSLERAQDFVDQYLGLEPSDTVKSIPLAIFADPTLGGVVEYCEPIQVQAYGDIEIAGQTYFQGRLTVTVSATQD